MRSTCSSVASPSCTSRSASRPNGRLQRLTRKPGPSAASITCRPIARAELARGLERRLAGALARHDLDELHHRRRVEEVHADHALGPGHAGGDLGHAQRRRVGGEHAVVAHDLGDAPEQLALELERLRRRLDHDVGVGQRGESSAASTGRPRRRRAAPSRPRAPAARAIAGSPRSSASASGSCTSVRAPAAAASWAMPAPIVPAPRTPTITRGHERVEPGLGAPDDQLLDLRRALVERRHAHVAVVALDRVVVDVARAAVDLDREVRAVLRRLGRVELGDRRLGGRRAALVLEEAGAVDEHAARRRSARACRRSSPARAGTTPIGRPNCSRSLA